MARLSSESSSLGRSPAPAAEPAPARPAAGPLRAGRLAAVVEWLIWLLIVGFAYSQTAYFDEEIATYRFGATGWPRAICLMIALGATGQFAYRLFGPGGARAEPHAAPLKAPGTVKTAQRAGIFVLPFLYLYAVPWLGFYVATPAFIVALLLLLEVRSKRAIAGVTTIICLLVLVLFTRFFFVALPNGRLDGFYEVNNAIIDIARSGM